MKKSYDVAVIGAGPAGYVAAIRCSQLGLDTVCIDRWSAQDGSPALGGTCLNVGCIPSKALLDSTERYHHVVHSSGDHGILVDSVSMDIGVMMRRKEKIVDSLTSGVAGLLKANNVESIHAHAQLGANRTIQLQDVNTGESKGEIQAKHVILASGSVPIELSGMEFDGNRIVDSEGALEFADVPGKLGIVGAGVIGLELGSVWCRLGAKVTILEALDDFLPMVDHEIAKEAARQFKKQGLDIRLGASVENANASSRNVQINYLQDGKKHQLTVDRLIICVGRRAFTDNLITEDSGIKLDERGFVEVDEHCQTSVENVYAVGDCVRGLMLAHKGSEEGVAVAERIATGYGHVNYETIPSAIYTSPEIAWVGLTENAVKASGQSCNCGTFPFAATGRAKAMNDTAGLVKVIADSQDDRILGVHIFGPHASELIAEAVVAMEYHASAEDLARTVHAHPTLSEAVHEAALAVDLRAIHKVNRK